MLTADGCRERRARLFAALADEVDWVLLSEPRHLMYFANFYASPFIFRTQNASALLVLGADGSSTLITDNMLGVFAAKAHVDDRIQGKWYTGAGSAPERQGVLVEAGLAAMQPRGGGHIGFDQMVPAQVSLSLAYTRGGLEATFINAAAAVLMRRKDRTKSSCCGGRSARWKPRSRPRETASAPA
jgi:Creatinase/Prolidase N-terminal domain